MTLWGMAMGAEESMKAAVAGLVPADKRGSIMGYLTQAMAYMVSGWGVWQSVFCTIAQLLG